MNHPLSYLQTFGEAGDPVTRLGWGLGAISLVVLLVVTVALVGGVLRRRRGAAPGELAVRRDAGGLSWIYVGSAITAVVLAGCALWTMLVLRAIAMPASMVGLNVQVTAAQWWWRMRYAGGPGMPVFSTANELHIPVGTPVRVELQSEDVIHSFWIPRLAGKVDMIPGQTNVMWLQAREPGTYRGQCGEFCGAQHAHMALEVVAQAPQDFERWRATQAADAAPTTDARLQGGGRLFVSHCGACHTVRGTEAGGVMGPDLSHLMERHTLAAGELPNDAQHLREWISDPSAVKPGTRMPKPRLSSDELQAVVGWLQTLQ